jgi:hypothetical protein
MAIQQNQKRIRTTHIGSLPRPHAVLDLLKPKLNGQPYDKKVLDTTVAQTVADQVKKQVECGIDIVSDGEMSKAGFFTYIRERLEGFEARPNEKVALFQKEVSAFPEYYEQYFKEAMLGGALAPLAPVVCVGPVKYVGEAALQKDIAISRPRPRQRVCPTNRSSCRRRRHQVSDATSITRPRKSTSTPSPLRSSTNTRRSSRPVSCSRPTIRSCRTSFSNRASGGRGDPARGSALAPPEQSRARRSRQGTDPPGSPLLPVRR